MVGRWFEGRLLRGGRLGVALGAEGGPDLNCPPTRMGLARRPTSTEPGRSSAGRLAARDRW
jgi:hypothetical protein